MYIGHVAVGRPSSHSLQPTMQLLRLLATIIQWTTKRAAAGAPCTLDEYRAIVASSRDAQKSECMTVLAMAASYPVSCEGHCNFDWSSLPARAFFRHAMSYQVAFDW